MPGRPFDDQGGLDGLRQIHRLLGDHGLEAVRAEGFRDGGNRGALRGSPGPMRNAGERPDGPFDPAGVHEGLEARGAPRERIRTPAGRENAESENGRGAPPARHGLRAPAEARRVGRPPSARRFAITSCSRARENAAAR